MTLQMELLHGFHLDPVNGRWFRPPSGYSKLNVEGSVREGKSMYGGILRNDQGQWVWGFTGFCGHASPLQAELVAIKEGLSAIHHHGLFRVILNPTLQKLFISSMMFQIQITRCCSWFLSANVFTSVCGIVQ